MENPRYNSRFEASIVPICSSPNKKHYARSEGEESQKTAAADAMLRSKEPLHYNPLQDKNTNSYLTAPVVMQHLIKQGFMANDGSFFPSRDEEHQMNEIRKIVNEQRAVVNKIERKSDARLERLQKCAHVNELVFTKDGIYEIDQHRYPVLRRLMATEKEEKEEKVKIKKSSKRKKKRQFHIEKEKGKRRFPDTYVLYPAENDEFLSFSSTPSIPPPSLKPAQDAFTSKPMEEKLRSSPPLERPLHFHLAASNLTKAAKSLKDAIQSRDTTDSSDRDELCSCSPTEEKKRLVRAPLWQSTGVSGPARASKSTPLDAMSRRRHSVSPLSPPHSVERANKDAVRPPTQATKKRGRASSHRKKLSSSVEEVVIETTDEAKLPKLAFKGSSKCYISNNKKSKSSMTLREFPTALNTLHLWSRKWPDKDKDRSSNLENAIKRMTEKYGETPPEEADNSGIEKKWKRQDPTFIKSILHSKPESPETAEVGIQTRETSVRDLDREDLLELLRELVVTPRRHLDSVMEMIEKEFSQPDISYNKMLKHVHEYSAIEDYRDTVLDEELVAPCQNQLSVIEEYGSGSNGQELQRAAGFNQAPSGSHLRVSAAPALASLARHVVDDFMFDQNMISGSMASKGLPAMKKNEAINYVIEHGAHGLHKSISFQPQGASEYEGDSKATSSQESSERSHSGSLRTRSDSRSPFQRSPSMASCHFNKVSGGVYHMYLRKDGTAYFSMLSPKERGASSHSSYLGSYRENKDAKMTLVASPSTLSNHTSENDIDFSAHESSSSLVGTSCRVERVPGFNYYKYRKKDGSSFLTTVSPKAWGSSCPHTFVKAYRETKTGVLVPLKTKSTASLPGSKSEPPPESNRGSTDTKKDVALLERPPTPLPESVRENRPDYMPHSRSDPIIHPDRSSRDSKGEDKRLRKAFSSVECSFPTLPGKMYHLYRRSDSSVFLSTLPPQEVDAYIQDTFVGSYIQDEDGRMLLVESVPPSDLSPPSVIICDGNKDLISSVNPEAIAYGTSSDGRPPSRELVDALLQASNEQFNTSENSSKSWIDEFLIEVNSARELGLPTHRSERELCEGLKKLSPKNSQASQKVTRTLSLSSAHGGDSSKS